MPDDVARDLHLNRFACAMSIALLFSVPTVAAAENIIVPEYTPYANVLANTGSSEVAAALDPLKEKSWAGKFTDRVLGRGNQDLIKYSLTLTGVGPGKREWDVVCGFQTPAPGQIVLKANQNTPIEKPSGKIGCLVPTLRVPKAIGRDEVMTVTLIGQEGSGKKFEVDSVAIDSPKFYSDIKVSAASLTNLDTSSYFILAPRSDEFPGFAPQSPQATERYKTLLIAKALGEKLSLETLSINVPGKIEEDKIDAVYAFFLEYGDGTLGDNFGFLTLCASTLGGGNLLKRCTLVHPGEFRDKMVASTTDTAPLKEVDQSDIAPEPPSLPPFDCPKIKNGEKSIQITKNRNDRPVWKIRARRSNGEIATLYLVSNRFSLSVQTEFERGTDIKTFVKVHPGVQVGSFVGTVVDVPCMGVVGIESGSLQYEATLNDYSELIIESKVLNTFTHYYGLYEVPVAAPNILRKSKSIWQEPTYCGDMAEGVLLAFDDLVPKSELSLFNQVYNHSESYQGGVSTCTCEAPGGNCFVGPEKQRVFDSEIHLFDFLLKLDSKTFSRSSVGKWLGKSYVAMDAMRAFWEMGLRRYYSVEASTEAQNITIFIEKVNVARRLFGLPLIAESALSSEKSCKIDKATIMQPILKKLYDEMNNILAGNTEEVLRLCKTVDD